MSLDGDLSTVQLEKIRGDSYYQGKTRYLKYGSDRTIDFVPNKWQQAGAKL